MSWLIFCWSLTVSHLSESSVGVASSDYQQSLIDNSGLYSLTLSGELKAFDHLRAYGEIETIAKRLKPLAYMPYESQYRIGFEAYTKNLAIGIRHECDHPTYSSRSQPLQLFGQETEIYFTLRGSTSF